MLGKSVLWAISLILASALPASAGLIVAIDNLTLARGSLGTVNVTITNTGSTAVDLDNFALRFEIATTGQTQLAFTQSQTDPFSNPNYVFFGNSLDQDTSSPLGTVGTTRIPFDSYIGGDATNDGNELLLSGTKFLTTLQVSTATQQPPTAGNQFTIGLAATDPQGYPSTYFNGNQGNIAYSVTGGQITVVPEPASWSLVVLGAVSALALLRRRSCRREMAIPASAAGWLHRSPG